jgi:hypothetical protein
MADIFIRWFEVHPLIGIPPGIFTGDPIGKLNGESS